MIRGINRRIIEINDTGSEFFEKALFFVKSNEVPDNLKLENEARRIMLSYMTDNKGGKPLSLRYTYKRKMFIKTAVVIATLACAATVILIIKMS